MKVSIGLLLSSGFPVPVPFLLGLIDLQTHVLTGLTNRALRDLVGADGPTVDELRIIRSEGFPVDTARNDVVREFLDHGGGDYLLFLDADMSHPANLLARLLWVAENPTGPRPEIVSGRYQMRKPPFHTCAMRKSGPGARDYDAIPETTGVVDVDAVGAGCLLIRRSVLLRMRETLGDDWFRYQSDRRGLRTISEDMWFCERAKDAGARILVDLGAVCGHVGQFTITPEWAEPWRQSYDAARLPGEQVG